MAEVEDRDKSHHISSTTTTTPMSDFSRDLLKRFITVNHHHRHMKVEQREEEEEEEEEEIELSLGLSMNGRFGVDPIAKKIKRTSSIPEFVNPVRDEELGHVVPMASTPLIRTCSLPTATEEEWRKRKELQTLRRMEARRKRSEKQRNLKAMRERNRALFEESGLEEVEFNSLKRTASLTSKVSGLGLNGEKDKEKEKGSSGLPPPSPSQGSIGSSQGTGSSGISESECQQGQGIKPMDARSPIGAYLLREGEQKSPVASSGASTTTARDQSNKHSLPENRTKDIVRNLLEDMPCVSTKGEGPDGKRIEGFLYRYGKGEEVRIVCVCHGSFLTPAEFVKHAGGGDVTNPLKHIVVSPTML